MMPSGAPTEETIQKIAALLKPDDIIIDGGNTNFHDGLRRADELKKRGAHYADAGTNGGLWGLKLGYCLMVGGESDRRSVSADGEEFFPATQRGGLEVLEHDHIGSRVERPVAARMVQCMI